MSVGARGARIPSETQHRDLHVLAAELQRLVAAPHVEIEEAALHLRAGVHHGVHAVVAIVADGDVEHAADRQQRRIGRGDAGAHADA